MTPQSDKTQPLDQSENIEKPSSNNNVTSIQNHLLILLYIQWFVFFITLNVGIYSVLAGNAADTSSGIQSLIPIIVLVIYYSLGLLVTYKKHRIGLLIFASVGIILFIAASLFIGYLTLAVAALGIGFGGNVDQIYKFTAFIGIIYTVITIIAIMSLKFTFDLAKSIKTAEYSTV